MIISIITIYWTDKWGALIIRVEVARGPIEEGHMSNACMIGAISEPYAPPSRPGSAPLEAIGRYLGYTEKELALAAEVLNRFVWRPQSGGNGQPTEAGTNDSGPDRKWAA